MSRADNKLIAENTVQYFNNKEKERINDYIKEGTLKLSEKAINIEVKKVILEVNEKDVVNSLIEESNKGKKVGVLNFASAKNPGGGFLGGASAQEESLCRSSDLYFYLKDESRYYKNTKHFKNGLYSNDVMYSKDVTFIKDGKGNRLKEEVFVDVITCAAVNYGDIKKKNQNELFKLVDKEMLERVENIIKVALNNKVDVLILGAFGCGVFGNSGYKVKGYFENVLNRKEYKGKFEKIVFSIYKDQNLYNIFRGIRV